MLNIKSGKNWLKKNKGEVKFAKFPNLKLKKELIEKISSLNLDITCLVIEKNQSQLFYEEKRNILFMMLENHIENKHKFPFKAVLDNDFLCLKKRGYLFLRNYGELDENRKVIGNSSQVVFSEFISGAIFREYELGDKTFTNIIRENNNLKIKMKRISKNTI